MEISSSSCLFVPCLLMGTQSHYSDFHGYSEWTARGWLGALSNGSAKGVLAEGLEVLTHLSKLGCATTSKGISKWLSCFVALSALAPMRL